MNVGVRSCMPVGVAVGGIEVAVGVGGAATELAGSGEGDAGTSPSRQVSSISCKAARSGGVTERDHVPLMRTQSVAYSHQ